MEDEDKKDDVIVAEEATVEDQEDNSEDELEIPDSEEEPEAEEDEPAEGEFVVTIGEAEDDGEDNSTIRELRKANQEKSKRIRELEAANQEPPKELGERPTLESCDYDEDAFAEALTDYTERKKQADAEAEKQRNQIERLENRMQESRKRYDTAKAELPVKDFDDAEATVSEALSKMHTGIIIARAENPEVLVYALAKNPKRLAEFATHETPADIGYALAKLESEMKVTSNTKPKPDRGVKGVSTPQTVDRTLEKAREKAAKTGDFSEVHRIKAQRRAAK